MNCRAVRKHFVDLLDVACDTQEHEALMAHLHTCPQCTNEFAAMKRAMEGVRPKHRIGASPALMENVLKEVMESAALMDTPARTGRRTRLWLPIFAAPLAAALLLAASFGYWLIQSGGYKPLSAFNVLGRAAHAMQGLQSVHIEAQMRTIPGDNFELILLDQDMVPIELWRGFGEPPQWRVETSGRVVVCDGNTSLLWIKESNVASEAPPTAGHIGWLAPLMDVEHILDSELQLAEEQGSTVTVQEVIGPDGAPELLVSVEALAQGDYTNDWMLNKSISDSDNLRVYRLDAETLWLKGLQVYVHTDKIDVLVFETDNIEYNAEFPDTLFALELPDDVSWLDSQRRTDVPAEARNLTPEETARVFLEACSREDWDTVQVFYPVTPIPELFKKHLGGMQLVSLGTPFQSGQFPGWFVPYEIRLKNGEVKKHNLTVRNDNAAGIYQVDGGI
ncbi:MAG: zf-HC2 domain-containing protein [Candidatus Hydrogenedentes bacterium]|nr:zf-HC2 domain-containing protein [Candidatus Hydrogenedentota bacterium]